MKSNLGNADKIIRVLVAIVLVTLYYMGLISGTLAIVFLVLAAIFVATSFMSFCPIYFLFGLSTRK